MPAGSAARRARPTSLARRRGRRRGAAGARHRSPLGLVAPAPSRGFGCGSRERRVAGGGPAHRPGAAADPDCGHWALALATDLVRPMAVGLQALRAEPGADGIAARSVAADLRSRRPVSEAIGQPVTRDAPRPLVAWSVLAVASIGVLLSGAELMVVAIALAEHRGRLRWLGRPGAMSLDHQRLPPGIRGRHAPRGQGRGPVGQHVGSTSLPWCSSRWQPAAVSRRWPDRNGDRRADRRTGDPGLRWRRAGAALDEPRRPTSSRAAPGPRRWASREPPRSSAWRRPGLWQPGSSQNVSLPIPGLASRAGSGSSSQRPHRDHRAVGHLRRRGGGGDAAIRGRHGLIGAAAPVGRTGRRRGGVTRPVGWGWADPLVLGGLALFVLAAGAFVWYRATARTRSSTRACSGFVASAPPTR